MSDLDAQIDRRLVRTLAGTLRALLYDPVTGRILVEKGVFAHRDLRVPVTAVESVDGGSSAIYLSVHMADLRRIEQT